MKETNKKKAIFWRIFINFILAGASVYLFRFWFNKVSELPVDKMIANIGAIAMLVATFFVIKTYYSRGTFNQLKRISLAILMSGSSLAMILYSIDSLSDIPYPLSGVIITLIAFYMVSLTASGTLGLIGVTGWAFLFATPISIAKMFNYISWGTTAELAQASVVLILFIGGTWGYIQLALHGVRSTNNVGGGYAGDDRDGDGDTGDED